MIGATSFALCFPEVAEETDGEGEPCGDCFGDPSRVGEAGKEEPVEGEATIMGDVPLRDATAGAAGEEGKGSGVGSYAISTFDASKLGDEEGSVVKPLVTVMITGEAVTFTMTVLKTVLVAGGEWTSSDNVVSKSARCGGPEVVGAASIAKIEYTPEKTIVGVSLGMRVIADVGTAAGSDIGRARALKAPPKRRKASRLCMMIVRGERTDRPEDNRSTP